MLQVTNGTVSRTYKVGDYEPRVVSLSFNIDPGSDVESLVADVVGMVERIARGTPVQVTKPAPVEAKQADPPTVETAAGPTRPPDLPTDVPVAPSVPTADDVVNAAKAAVSRVGAENRHQVTAVVNRFVAEPNMPVRSISEDKRMDAIAALAELGKPAASADY